MIMVFRDSRLTFDSTNGIREEIAEDTLAFDFEVPA